MSDRLQESRSLLSPDFGFVIAIDENEQENLGLLLDEVFPLARKHNIALVHNKKGIQGADFSYCHEYAYFVLGDKLSGTFNKPIKEEEWDWANLRKWGSESTRDTAANCFYPILVKDQKIIGFGDVCDNEFHPGSNNIAKEGGVVEVYPVDAGGVERKWRYERGTVEGIVDVLKVKESRSGEVQIFKAKSMQQPKTIWDDSKYIAGDFGTKVVTDMGIATEESLFPKSVHSVVDSIFTISDKNQTVLDFFAGSGTTAHAVIKINRDQGQKRKYILAEMGRHFDNVILPRIKKVVYSEDWKYGAPVVGEKGGYGGVSHAFKYIRLESYEDALGNLAVSRSDNQQKLLDGPQDEAREAYILNYMLGLETMSSNSLLNVADFLDPERYKLNVRSASGDETRPVNVDLLETFNYLLGLEVAYIAAPIHFDAELSQGEYGRWLAKVKRQDDGKWWFRTVYGTNRNGQKVLVVWRNLPSVIEGVEDGIQYDNAVLDAVLIEKLQIRLTESQDDEVDILYVNGDHNIAIPRNRKGEPMEQARIQLIEEAFHRLMFADTESVQ